MKIILILVATLGYIHTVDLEKCHNHYFSEAPSTMMSSIDAEDCLKHALLHHNTELTFLIIKSHTDFQQQFISIISKERHRLQALQDDIIIKESQAQPVVKWGQSSESIYITWKLSHRWDAPPCLNVKSGSALLKSSRVNHSQNPNLKDPKLQNKSNSDSQSSNQQNSAQETISSQEDQKYVQNRQVNTDMPKFWSEEQYTLQIFYICLVSHQKLTFKKSLPLWGPILSKSLNQSAKNSENLVQSVDLVFQLSPKKDGVGTYVLILPKKHFNQTWLYLAQGKQSFLLWNQICNRFSTQCNAYKNLVLDSQNHNSKPPQAKQREIITQGVDSNNVEQNIYTDAIVNTFDINNKSQNEMEQNKKSEDDGTERESKQAFQQQEMNIQIQNTIKQQQNKDSSHQYLPTSNHEQL